MNKPMGKVMGLFVKFLQSSCKGTTVENDKTGDSKKDESEAAGSTTADVDTKNVVTPKKKQERGE